MKCIKWIILTSWLLLMGGCDKDKDAVVIIHTSFGDMHVLLYDETPLHKANFLKLASEKYYDSTTFHRVISDFMIQGGDVLSKDKNPLNDGQGGPGYTIPAEFHPQLIHKKGALAAARLGGDVNPKKESSGSQFYLVQGKVFTNEQLDAMENNINTQDQNRLLSEYIMDPQHADDLKELRRHQDNKQQDSINALVSKLRPLAEKGYTPFAYSAQQRKVYTTLGGTPHLDGGYTVFGEIIKGLEVVDVIAKQPKSPGDRPLTDIRMTVEVKEMSRKKISETYGYTYPTTAEKP